MLKLIAIDMDGTLLRDDKTYERQKFEQLLEQLNDLGITVCIASGNSYHKLVDFFSPKVIERLIFASDNGNYLVQNHRVSRIVGIERTTVLAIVDYFDNIPNTYISISAGNNTYFRDGTGPAYDQVVKYNNELSLVKDFNEIPEQEAVTKIAIFSPSSLAKNKVIVKNVSTAFQDVSVVTSGDEWIDIYHVTGGKGSALAYLQNTLQISPENSMAFGDNLNDETMMQQVAYSVAMGNADVDLLLHCHYHIGTNEQQAVTAILEQVIADPTLAFMQQYKINR